MREEIKNYLFQLIIEKEGNIDNAEVSKLIVDKYPSSNWNTDLLNWYKYHITSERGRYYSMFNPKIRENINKNFEPRRKRSNTKRSSNNRNKNDNHQIGQSRRSEKRMYAFEFDKTLLAEANNMSQNYEILYCLEKTIRRLVSEHMEDKYGVNWWEIKVGDEIKRKVDYSKKQEMNTGHSKFSEKEIDYTTFGSLRQLIEQNWEDLSSIFKNKHAFNRIMYTLNQLRGPVAHNNYLTEDEETRLVLTVKDWFRLIIVE